MRSCGRRLLNGSAVRGCVVKAEQYARMLVRPHFWRPHPDPRAPSGCSGLRRRHADRPALVLTDRRTLRGTRRRRGAAAAGEEKDARQEHHRARRRHPARCRRHRPFVVLTLHLVSVHCPVTEGTASAGCLALAHPRPAGVRHVIPASRRRIPRATASHHHATAAKYFPTGLQLRVARCPRQGYAACDHALRYEARFRQRAVSRRCRQHEDTSSYRCRNHHRHRVRGSGDFGPCAKCAVHGAARL